MTKSLRRRVSNELKGRGFIEDHGIHVRAIDGDADLLVDVGPLDGGGAVAPYVGIHHRDVMDLLIRLQGLPPSEHPTTAGANVGEILGRRYEEFREPTPVEDVMKTIDEAARILVPLATVDGLARIAADVKAVQPSALVMVAISLLRRDRAAVENWLAVAEAAQCRFQDEICERFRRFKRGVERELQAS